MVRFYFGGTMTMKTGIADRVRTKAKNDPAIQELYKLLLKSEKFVNWTVDRFFDKSGDRLAGLTPAVDDKHFAPGELAEAWGVSTETVRQIFRDEPGVLKIGKPGTRTKRGYFTLRIPKEVAERVHRRLSA
jgi:hypothetical protein